MYKKVIRKAVLALSFCLLVAIPPDSLWSQSSSYEAFPIPGQAPGRVQVRAKAGANSTSLAGGRLRLQNPVIKWSFSGTSIVITSLSGGLGGGVVKANGFVHTSKSEAPQWANVEFQNVESAELLRALHVPGADLLKMRLSGRLNLRWKGTETASILRSLDGTVVVQAGPGSLEHAAITKSLAKLSGIGELEHIRFSQGKVQASIRQGKASVSTASLSGELFRLSAQGTVDLKSEDINLSTKLSVSPELAQKSSIVRIGSVLGFLGVAKDDPPAESPREFVSVPGFWLTGKLRNPTLDFSGKGKAVAQNTLPTEP